MMERYIIIGYATRASHPYEVAIYWDSAPSPRPRTIALSEGCGHSAMGSCFPLAARLETTWTEPLQICGCLWLRDLALEEQDKGRIFSADEILEVWQGRAKRQR